MECTDPATFAVGPGFTWHMTAEILLLGEGWMIFSTSSCPSLIALSSLPAFFPSAGLFPTTLLAEDLACPASHSSYRCSAFFLFLSAASWTPPCSPHGPSPPPQGTNPTDWRNPGGKGLLFPYFHGDHSPSKGQGVGTEQAMRVPPSGCACPVGSGP